MSHTSDKRIYFSPTDGYSSSYANYGGLYYYKIGNIVHLHIGAYIPQMSTSSYTDLFTLPEGYRPANNGNVGCVGIGASLPGELSRIQVQSTGKILVYPGEKYALADLYYEAEN